jgi:ribokinase
VDALPFDIQARCSTFKRDDKMPPQMRAGKQRGEEIIVLGDINADIIGRVDSWPEPGEECLAKRVELHCGGVGANCALALRRWGVSARLIGCVGKDDFGGALLKTLGENDVDVRSIQRTGKAMTGLLYINVTPDGQRTFFGSRGANCLVRQQSRGSTVWKRAMAASFMGYSFLDPAPTAAAKQLLRAVQARGGWVSLDVGMEPSQKIPEQILRVAKQVDLLFVSSEEATALTGMGDPLESFRKLRKAGARDVVMKLGKRGCLILEEGVVRQVPSFAVRAVDSTGAGDAFTAAFLQARLRRWPAAEAAVAANAAGAAATSVVGAGENSPALRQIARLLRTQRLNDPWDAVRLRVLRRISIAGLKPGAYTTPRTGPSAGSGAGR